MGTEETKKQVIDGKEFNDVAWLDKASRKKSLKATIGELNPSKNPSQLFIGNHLGMVDFLDQLYQFMEKKGIKAKDLPEELLEYRPLVTLEGSDDYWKVYKFETLWDKVKFLKFASTYYTRNLDGDDGIGVDGKPLNSRPKILADCIRRLESVKQDLEQLQTEYEEWSQNINEGATQDKCNDAEQMLGDQAYSVDEVITELEGLEGELPMGFGRD